MSVDTYFIIVAVAVLFILTEGKLTGKCTDYKYPTKDTFDVDKYLGTWYVIGNLHSNGVMANDRCVQAVYTDGPDDTIGIVHSGLGPDGMMNSVSGTGYYDGAVKSKLTMLVPNLSASAKWSYWVLDTDYDTYSFVWACKDQTVDIAWILGRKRTMEPAVVDAAKQKMEVLGIDTKQFTVTNQNNSEEVVKDKIQSL